MHRVSLSCLGFSALSVHRKRRAEPARSPSSGLPARPPRDVEAPDSFVRLKQAMPAQAEPASAGQPAPRHATWASMRARAGQLLNTRKVLHEPAERFEGDWQARASLDICRSWIESQVEHNTGTVSVAALSRMKALEYERRNPDAVPRDRRLLPAGAGRKDYYEAEILAFLEAVGEKDPQAVLQSFKKAGVGGLHRQRVVAASSAGGAIGVAQILVPEPTTKAVLAGIRFMLQAVTNALAVESSYRRFRNAGTEEVMPRGKADAPPSLKKSKEVMAASAGVIAHLHGVKKNLRRMESAVLALESAGTPEAASEAKDQLELAFARFCYLQHSIKEPYKAAIEAAKIEFRGNERNLYTSYVGGALGYVAGVMAILTPVVLSAPVTGGFSAAAVGAAGALYVGYQLSNGPSKDGAAKARRAIVALAKSVDILAGDKIKSQHQRAQAYEAYMAQRNKARWKLKPSERAAIKAKARADLLARLAEISKADTAGPVFGPRENWEAYTAYEASRAKTASEGQAALKQEFERAHAADFDLKTVADAWKVPMRMRFDGARRLVAGEAAQAHRALLGFEDESARGKLRRPGWERAHARRRAELEQALKARLLDVFNLELALQRMKPAIASGNADDAETAARAAQALGAVCNGAVHDLFCGDARAQVEAMKQAKRLAYGEQQRYTYTLLGANLPVMASNQVVLGISMGLAIDKAEKASHGIHVPSRFADERDAVLTSQTGATATAHIAAGGRAGFSEQEMKPQKSVLARKGDPIEARAALPVGDRASLEAGDPQVDAALDALVAQMRGVNGVADRVELSLPEAAGLAADLQSTTPYQQRQYDTASTGTKARFHKKQAGTVLQYATSSLAGLPMQGLSKFWVKSSRQPLKDSAAMGPKVRELLSRDAEQQLARNAERGPPEPAAPKKKGNPFRSALDKVRKLGSTHDTLDTRKPQVPAMPPTTGNPFVLPPSGSGPASLSFDVGEIERIARGRLAAVDAAAEAVAKIRRIQPWGGASGSALVEGSIEPTPAFRFQPARREQGRRFFDEEFERMRRLMGPTRQWLAGQGIRAAPNGSGDGINCLIRALLQHATGDYGQSHAERASAYRSEMLRQPGFSHIGPGDMLVPDDPAFAWLVARINRDTGRRMNVLIVQPGEGGRPVILPTKPTGDDDVGLLQGPDHFEALTLAAGAPA